MTKDTYQFERTAWDYIPPNSECERDDCKSVAVNVHHTLQQSFNDRVIRADGSQIDRRNQRHFIQWLCDKHHHAEGHNLFSETGKWPKGYGTEEAPFRRNCAQVEALITARLRAQIIVTPSEPPL